MVNQNLSYLTKWGEKNSKDVHTYFLVPMAEFPLRFHPQANRNEVLASLPAVIVLSTPAAPNYSFNLTG